MGCSARSLPALRRKRRFFANTTIHALNNCSSFLFRVFDDNRRAWTLPTESRRWFSVPRTLPWQGRVARRRVEFDFGPGGHPPIAMGLGFLVDMLDRHPKRSDDINHVDGKVVCFVLEPLCTPFETTVHTDPQPRTRVGKWCTPCHAMPFRRATNSRIEFVLRVIGRYVQGDSCTSRPDSRAFKPRSGGACRRQVRLR